MLLCLHLAMESAKTFVPPPKSKPELDPGVFERNLAALCEVDPELAACVAAAKPSGSEPLLRQTRDGGSNFSLSQPDGGESWFGRTSIPLVRAEALLGQFHPGMGNVLLAGMGEGTEATLLTKRLACHQAVFAWDPDSVSVRLALQLHDVSEAIRRQRLILLVCSDEQLTDTLCVWLAGHPGHLCPERIMIWPWHSHSEANSLRTRVEAAFHQTQAQRARALADLQAGAIGKSQPATKDLPKVEAANCVGILAIRAADETWMLAEDLAAGAQSSGWTPVSSTIRGPADMHPLARAQKLAAEAAWPPQWAVLLDMTRQEIRDVLPAQVPAVCWLQPGPSFDANLPARVGSDPIAVTCSAQRDRAVAFGIPPEQITICPPACVVSPAVEGGPAERDIDVLILADESPTDAASFGFQLPSHTAVWDRVTEMAAARLEKLVPEDLPSLLAAAERNTGAQLDEQLRQSIIEALLQRIVPTLMGRVLLETLKRQGFTAHVVSVAPGAGQTPLPERVELAGRAKVGIHLDMTGTGNGEALLLASAGAAVVARHCQHSGQAGGLGMLLREGSEMLSFRSVGQMAGHLRRLLTDQTYRQALSTAAIERCRAEHTPADRLRRLHAALSSWLRRP